MKVSDLKKLKFFSLPLDVQLEIKRKGKPVPDLNFSQVQKKCKGRGEFTRRFNRKVYEHTNWICGCEENNSLYCFVCLLLGGDDSWTKNGITDLKHLLYKINKHESSVKHKNNLISFQLLGKRNPLDSSTLDNLREHNQRVEKNRKILYRIVDILKLCGKCNLPLGGHQNNSDNKLYDNYDSYNKGGLFQLIDYTRNVDPVFNAHMEGEQFFKSDSQQIQTELLECMLDVCRQQITKEIKETSFLSIMIDDVSQGSHRPQTAVVFRYELKGRLHERFWAFTEDQDPAALSQFILQQLDLVLENNTDKLIAQTYDGVARFRGLHDLIGQKYDKAHYVYSYSHPLTTFIEQVSSTVPGVNVFFANLDGIASFFTQSSEGAAALGHMCQGETTQWDFQSNPLHTIISRKGDILACFENVQAQVPEVYSFETVALAAGYASYLESPVCSFWLAFFSDLMAHVDVLCDRLQVLQTDPAGMEAAIAEFEKAVVATRNAVPPIVKMEPDSEEPRQPTKKARFLDENCLNSGAVDVCEAVLREIGDRFQFMNHLFGEKIFQYDRLTVLRKDGPPISDVMKFCDKFPVVDKSSLLTELIIFYSRPEIVRENLDGCLKTLDFVRTYELEPALKEITKTLRILVTIPAITAEPQRCFPTLDVIKNFFRAAKNHEELNPLAMIFTEQTMISQMPEFNNLVLEKFVSNEKRRQQFLYMC